MAKIGFSKVEISCDKEMLLAGYDCQRWSKGIHDSLFCRIIVIENEGQKSCFGQFDVLCVGDQFIQQLKEVAISYGIQNDNVIIGAIHTHSGPKGLATIKGLEGIFGKYDEEYVHACIIKFTECLSKACQHLQDFTLKISHQTINNVCSERHNADFQYDNQLWKIEFMLKNNQKIMMYNYSCHPTILHADNLYMSADLPGSVDQFLNPEYAMVMFYNGSAGDVSTRFTRKGSNFEEVQRLGRILVDQIKRNPETVVYRGPLDKLKVHKKSIQLQTWSNDHIYSFENYIKDLEKRISEGDLSKMSERQEALMNYRFIKNLDGTFDSQLFDFQFDILEFNNCAIITIPSEITSSLTFALTQKYQCMIFSYVGGYHLYLPSQDAFDLHYYESAVCMIDQGVGEKLISYIDSCLNEINIKRRKKNVS